MVFLKELWCGIVCRVTKTLPTLPYNQHKAFSYNCTFELDYSVQCLPRKKQVVRKIVTVK